VGKKGGTTIYSGQIEGKGEFSQTLGVFSLKGWKALGGGIKLTGKSGSTRLTERRGRGGIFKKGLGESRKKEERKWVKGGFKALKCQRGEDIEEQP